MIGTPDLNQQEQSKEMTNPNEKDVDNLDQELQDPSHGAAQIKVSNTINNVTKE